MDSPDLSRRIATLCCEVRLIFVMAASVVLVVSGSACRQDDDETDIPLEEGPTILDQDDDSILDVHEGSDDADGDGTPNYLDQDSDGDGLADSLEAGDEDLMTFPRDSDGDGVADFLDSDSDENGIPDQIEVGINPMAPVDFDGDEMPDYVDPDNDGDLISDVEEIGGLIPLDTDSDAYPDYYDQDSDGDTILDLDEAGALRRDWKGNARIPRKVSTAAAS